MHLMQLPCLIIQTNSQVRQVKDGDGDADGE